MQKKLLNFFFTAILLFPILVFANDCTNPIPLQCGVPYSGTTVGSTDDISNYSCCAFDMIAGDNIHSFVAPSTGSVTVYVTKPASIDMRIGFLSACTGDSAIDRTGNPFFSSNIDLSVSNLIPGKTYYITVDGDEPGDEGAYTIYVDCEGPAGTCADPVDVTEGVYYGFTQNGEQNFNTYSCGSQNEFGKEKIHRLTLQHQSDLTATITDLNGEDLDIMLLSSCNATTCIARDNDSIFAANLSPGIYYIVVDGFGTDTTNEGTYTLNINTNVIGAGTPGTCLNPIPLTCGVPKTGDNSTYFNNLERYSSCNILDFGDDGPEVIYSFVAPPSGNVSAILTRPSGIDLEVGILEGCGSDSCLNKTFTGQGTSVSTDVSGLTPGKTYYLVVEGDTPTDIGAYTVQIECYAGTCAEPIPLTCSVPYSGTTESTGQSDFDLYPCAIIGDTFASYEKIHTIVLTQQQDLTAELTLPGGDLDVFIMSACNASSCIAWGDDVATATNLPAGTYYIVVDGISFGGFPTHAQYTLTVTCGSGGSTFGTCSNPLPITCGTPYNGNTNDGQTNFSTYGCNNQQQFGKEKIHELTITDTNDLTINLSGLNGENLDLHVLNSCNPNDCRASGDSTLNLTGILPGTYYIVVDGFGSDTTQQGTYTLNVTCTPTIIANNPAACSELFFSEYIESSAQDKALEIYNPTNNAINLSAYNIELYANGSATATSTIALNGSIAPNGVYVITNASANSTMVSLSDTTSPNLTFNGNDAILLLNGTTPIDLIGVKGVNPGNAWIGGSASTTGQVLVRKQTVQNGIAAASSFDPSVEWDNYAPTDLSKLGKHQSICFTCSGGPVTATITDTICSNETYIVNGTPISASGTYTDSSYAASGCDSLTTINLTVNSATAITAVSDLDSIPVNGTVNFTASGSNWSNLLWDFGDSFTSAINPVSHTYTAPGTYTVIVSADNTSGCTSTDTLTIVVGNGISSIDKIETHINISIYPNPTNNSFTINYMDNVKDIQNISLYDVNGTLLLSNLYNKEASSKTVSLENYPSGVYFLSITGPKINVHKRVIKN